MPGLGAGATATPRAPVAYVKAVSDAIDIPVSIFQYPLASGLGFTTETLVEMARLPKVIAIKEGSDTMFAYEENWRKVKAARPEVAILPSNFNWFLAQLAIGGDGILSGLASLTPHWLIDLWRAADLAASLGQETKASRPTSASSRPSASPRASSSGTGCRPAARRSSTTPRRRQSPATKRYVNRYVPGATR